VIRRAVVAVAVLLSSACISDLEPREPVALGTAPAKTVPSTLALPLPDTGDDDDAEVDHVVRLAPDEARALITPTGVVVPVLQQTSDGYQVMTPCGVETTLAWGTPIFSAEVAIDPGHGGTLETGAVGPNGLAEKDLNLDVARATARELTDRGISVVLTRTADYRVPLSVRATIGNQLGVRAMVSVHHNAPVVGASDHPGTEVFVQSGSDESRRLGGLIWESVFEALDQFDIDWVSAGDAGALLVINGNDEDSYGMIRRPEMPAALAELGYLASRVEAELFATDVYVRAASVALADAIQAFLDTDEPGSGFSEEPRRFTPDGSTGGSRGCTDPLLE
jgi:N-acetylmuramoyl-L-alanine amidase